MRHAIPIRVPNPSKRFCFLLLLVCLLLASLADAQQRGVKLAVAEKGSGRPVTVRSSSATTNTCTGPR